MTDWTPDRQGLLAVAEGFEEAANCLLHSFSWETSAEGRAYWSAQYEHMAALAIQLRQQA